MVDVNDGDLWNPSELVFAVKGLCADSKHMLFSTVWRTDIRFCMLLFSWASTVYSIVHDSIEENSKFCSSQQRLLNSGQEVNDDEVISAHFLVYVRAYYFQLFVIAPVTMLVYKTGSPLFLAAMEESVSCPNPFRGPGITTTDCVGSVKLIELAKSVMARVGERIVRPRRTWPFDYCRKTESGPNPMPS